MEITDKPLYEAVGEAGLNGMDITEGYGTVADMEDFMDFMHSYDVTADPSEDRYLIQDEDHQYEIRILESDPDNDQFIVMARDNGFAKEGIEYVNVLSDDDFYTASVEGATFNDGSEALASAARRAPEMSDDDRGKNSGEILEP